SVLAAASLMNLLKRQRDAVGLSVYSNRYEFYAPEKGSERHFRILLQAMEPLLEKPTVTRQTNSYTYVHQIAEKIQRRSFIAYFTDMFQTEIDSAQLSMALQHLKYNKHQVVLFHDLDKEKELIFQFENRAKRFVDIETNQEIDLFPEQIQQNHKKAMEQYHEMLKLRCAQYGIKYVEVDIAKNIHKILQAYLIEQQKFI